MLGLKSTLKYLKFPRPRLTAGDKTRWALRAQSQHNPGVVRFDLHRPSVRCSRCQLKRKGGRGPMEEFARLFGSLLALVYPLLTRPENIVHFCL
jgi:hypothetical protein